MIDRLQAAVSSLGLTPRQSEVVTLVVQGYTYAEIAERLTTSERTARQHAVDAQRRLGCASFRGLTRAVWCRLATVATNDN